MIKIKFDEEAELVLDINFKDIIIEQLSADEIFDAIEVAINKKKIYKPNIIEAIRDRYREEIGGLLHEFFNHKSDANKYLDAAEQEDLENDFIEWVDNY